MREEFVELKNKYKKLQYKNFVRFNKETEIKNDFKNVRKAPMFLAFIVFVVIEILIVKFLPWIFGVLIGLFLLYLVALICSCMVEIKVQNKKIYIKKFIFKKTIDEDKIKKIYLVTSKHEMFGGIRAKIKIIYKTKRGENVYPVDTMFLKYDNVEKLLKLIEVEPLTKEESKGKFDEKTFIDTSLFEFVDFVFLIPMAICVMIDFIM